MTKQYRQNIFRRLPCKGLSPQPLPSLLLCMAAAGAGFLFCAMQILYQSNPFRFCTYTKEKSRSFTDSMESYQDGAQKELQLLRRNDRIPTKELRWSLFNVYSVEDLKDLRSHVFKYLHKNGVEATASIELTREMVGGMPNNTVHFHIITDSPKTKEELCRLLQNGCSQWGLVRGKDYGIGYKELYDGYNYFKYFTKYGYEERVILFQKGLRVQKFYQFGWYKKTKKKLWDEIKEEMRRKYGDNATQPAGIVVRREPMRTRLYGSSGGAVSGVQRKPDTRLAPRINRPPRVVPVVAKQYDAKPSVQTIPLYRQSTHYKRE